MYKSCDSNHIARRGSDSGAAFEQEVLREDPTYIFAFRGRCCKPGMDRLASIVQQLQQERARIDAALRALTGASTTRGTARTGRRTLSAAARRKIAAAQRARWAKWKANRKK